MWKVLLAVLTCGGLAGMSLAEPAPASSKPASKPASSKPASAPSKPASAPSKPASASSKPAPSKPASSKQASSKRATKPPVAKPSPPRGDEDAPVQGSLGVLSLSTGGAFAELTAEESKALAEALAGPPAGAPQPSTGGAAPPSGSGRGVGGARWTPVVQFGETPLGSGDTMEWRKLRRHLVQRRSVLEGCFGDDMRARPARFQTARARFELGADGEIRATSVRDSTPKFERCVATTYRGTKVPSIDRAATIEVSIALVVSDPASPAH